jgi:hypothetical protein
MPMVGIREVRVLVGQRVVAMSVRVSHSGWHPLFVRMLMMLIMCVLMLMLDELMRVQMIVLLRQVQPHAKCHERAGNQQLHGYRLSKSCDRDDCTEKRRDGKVSPSARRAEMAQRDNE